MKDTQCTCCDAPDAAPFHRIEGDSEMLCTACARNAALIDAAQADLHAQLAPVVKAWAARWESAGVKPFDLGVVLSGEGQYWHPLCLRGRAGHPEDNARAFIAEVLSN